MHGLRGVDTPDVHAVPDKVDGKRVAVGLFDIRWCHGNQLTDVHAGPLHRPDDEVVMFALGRSCSENTLNLLTVEVVLNVLHMSEKGVVVPTFLDRRELVKML